MDGTFANTHRHTFTPLPLGLRLTRSEKNLKKIPSVVAKC